MEGEVKGIIINLKYIHKLSSGMAKTIKEMCEFLKEKKEDITFLEGLDRIRYLVELGDDHESTYPFPSKLKTEANRVKGCVSGAYIAAEFKNGRVYYQGMSEARTVFGYVAILAQALSGLTPEDIVNNSKGGIHDFIEGTNIKASLTPSRADAFGNVYKMIVMKAAEYM